MAKSDLISRIFTNNLAGTREFFTGVMNLQIVGEQPGEQVRFSFQSNSERRQLVLSVPSAPGTSGSPVGVKIAVDVADMHSLRANAAKAGVEIIPSSERAGKCALRGPNGVIVEVTETEILPVAEPEPPAGNPMAALSGFMDSFTPWAVRVACTLRVPELVRSGVTTVAGLAAAAEVNEDALGRLLRHLVESGLFTSPEPGVIEPTMLSDLIHHDHPAGLSVWLDLDGVANRWDRAFTELLTAIKTGEPVYAKVHGRTFWADLGETPALSESFDVLQAGQAGQTASTIVNAYDWLGAKHVVDVGGGSGSLLTAVLTAHPHLHGTLVEKEDTAACAARTFADAGLADRVTVQDKGFFEEVPAGGDVYVLVNVLHNWPDAQAEQIFAAVAAAAGRTGRILVVEGIVDGGGDQDFTAQMDMIMLVVFGGRVRTAGQFEELGAKSGFGVTAVHGTAGGLSVIEFAATGARS